MESVKSKVHRFLNVSQRLAIQEDKLKQPRITSLGLVEWAKDHFDVVTDRSTVGKILKQNYSDFGSKKKTRNQVNHPALEKKLLD